MGDYPHQLAVGERVADHVLHEPAQVHIGLDRFDTQPHDEPVVSGGPEIAHAASEVLLVIASACPGPELISSPQVLRGQEHGKPSQPARPRPVVVPPQIAGDLPVALLVVGEPSEEILKVV